MTPDLSYLRRHGVALLALFIALGGTSYAAAQLAKNSVGPRQIKPHGVVRGDIRPDAVDGSKVADGTLSAQDFKAGGLPSGPQGPTGPAGPHGSPGPAGPAGKAGNFGATLQSGQTLTGTWTVRGYRPGTSAVGASDAISFPVPLATAPIQAAMKRVVPNEPGEATTAQCPGSSGDPRAAAGVLCLYETARFGAGTPGFCNPTELTCNNIGTGSVSRTGMTLLYHGNANDAGFGAYGTWAVTTP